MTAPVLTIDVVSDVMCPWCYIGKRRLEDALAEVRNEFDVEVRWRPYQLDPTLPKEGKDRKQYLEEKFGGAAGAEQAYATVRAAGAEEDIPFAFDKIRVSANTLDAHRLIRWASSLGLPAQHQVVELLFKAYFERGCDTGDRQELLSIGRDLDLPYEALDRYLRSETDIDVVYEENARAHRLGISGVPSYLFNGAMMISGAQEPKVLARMIDAAITTSSD